MIKTLFDFFRRNFGLFILLIVGIFALGSMAISTINEAVNPPQQVAPLAPPTKPTTPTEPPAIEEDIDLSRTPDNLQQAEDMDTLISDLAVDVVMAVAGTGFGVEYYTSPDARLARIRSVVDDNVYNYFIKYYDSLDWKAIEREKVELFTDIGEIRTLDVSNTGNAAFEVQVKFFGDPTKVVKTKAERWFYIEMTRTPGFEAWIAIDIREIEK